MIKTSAISFDEIISLIPGDARIGIVGCGDCAATLGVGGTRQVEEMKEQIQKLGRNVVFAFVVRAPCDERALRRFIDLTTGFSDADHVIVLACSAGFQSLVSVSGHLGFSQNFIKGLKTEGLVKVTRNGSVRPACLFCSECHLISPSSICPVVSCPLKKADGPCQNRLEKNFCPHSEKICVYFESDKE
ncbi:MAG: methylenetetrahydrofolate reductase C-terminal domain-containing protein [Candidatus Riflebacteria bacterium]|nr:methylenetetrahydrofolate reductase C-terminal domain-containing protein [Candidatus Riflebacteria bacterium]